MKHAPCQRLAVGALAAALLAGITASGYAPRVVAADSKKDSSGEQQLTEVIVTGSRIARRDNQANSPIVTVDSKQLESQSGLNVESYLNQLPAYNPAATPTSEGTNSDVQISSINSVGIASISLRGFGANRSLTLVDGRRATPTNALMVVDVNSIPSSMIRSVEIISGGASAVYGADAMGGVSNFLLNRDFQGLQVDTQYGITDVGDNQEFRASILTGTKFGDGRGNVVFAAEYYNRKAAYDKNRSFYTNGYKDPTIGGNFIGFIFGENDWNQLFNPANSATVQTVTGRPCPYSTTNPNGSCVFNAAKFNADGTIWNPNGANSADWGGDPIDNFRYSLYNTYDNTKCTAASATLCPSGPTEIQALKYNETEGFTSNPQTRYAFMGASKYDITDKLHFESSARYSQSITETFLAGTNASYGWEATVPYNATTDSPVNPALNYSDQAVVAAVQANPAAYANPNFIAHGATGAQHPVPVEMAILLNSRAARAPGTFGPGDAGYDPYTSGWVMETFPLNSFGRRATYDTNESWQIETGLTYDLPIKDWTSEIYYSRGESSAYNVAFGNNSLARWRGEITAPDYGYHSNLQSNATNNGPGASYGFGSTPVPCTSGFYETIFNADAVPSADCQYAVQAPLQTRTQNQQDIFELNFQGGLVDLPAGEARGALGYQQRRNASQFNPDILQSTASFTDQVIGVYPTGYLDKQTVAKDIWAEAVIPVIGGLPFLQKLELDVGGRRSNYSSTESTTSYMIDANIQVNDSVRFRGGFNRATRAPNLGELYLPLQQIFTFGSSNFGDPCSLRSNNPFGAGGAAQSVDPADGVTAGVYAPGQTAAGATSTYLICQAQMGATAIGRYYQDPTVSQSAAPTSASFWINQTGNSNLNSEKADTYTFGVVLQSHLDSPLLRRMTATIDWYKININDAILPYTTDYAQFLCYGTTQVTNATEAAAQALTPACVNAVRNKGTGGITSTLVSYANQAWVKTSGVDFAFNWSADLADMGMANVPGSLNLSVQGTWLNTYKTKQSSEAFDPVVEWKGTSGPQLSSFNGGSYDYRLFTNIGYNLPAVGVNLRWQYLPSVAPGGVAVIDAKKANNAAVVAGAPGLILGYSPNTTLDTSAYSMFGLSGYWNINSTLSMRFGIDNLFNKKPPVTNATTGYPYDPALSAAANAANLAAVCGGAPGCGNPTGYSLASNGGGSNGGYYDELGRRYFIGLKARF